MRWGVAEDRPPLPGPTRRGPHPTEVRRLPYRRVLRGAALFTGVLILSISIGALFAWQWGRGIVAEFRAGDKEALVVDAQQVLGSPPATGALPQAVNSSAPPVVFLLIGSDTREVGKGGNSDTLVLARLDPATRRITMLSLPRDLKVDIPRHSPFKINAAYALGGPRLAIETVRDNFGVTIDHFIAVDFAGFQKIVDQVGGVWLTIDRRYYNRNSDGDGLKNYAEIDLQPGYQKLSGADALAFVRYRHADSDYVRQARQEMFLREIKRAAEDVSLRSLPGVVSSVAAAITSDLDSLPYVIDLVRTVRGMPAENMARITLPASGWTESDGRYYLHSSDEEIADTIARWSGQKPPREIEEGVAADVSSGTAEKRVTGVEPDAGVALSHLRAARPQLARWCAPTVRATGARWDQDTPARAYVLDGSPALALAGSLGPGKSYLLMQSTHPAPPLLSEPHTGIRRGGRLYRVYRSAGKTRTIAWQMGATKAWLSNTLLGNLSEETMLAIAASCRPEAPRT